jgi:hypothetical protein
MDSSTASNLLSRKSLLLEAQSSGERNYIFPLYNYLGPNAWRVITYAIVWLWIEVETNGSHTRVVYT